MSISMSVNRAVRVFKALSDPTRLRILRLLLRREICVCEIMFILGMEQTRVSHHMRVLREAGLAEDVRDGRWIIYRIPAGSRGVVENLLRGALGADVERSPETAGDLRKLEACVRENIRSRTCATPPPKSGRLANCGGAGTRGRVRGQMNARRSGWRS
jgi:ArsR family transcriptional regulator, arsenate/arsenite/antimonite-responsive transcriptional repressor